MLNHIFKEILNTKMKILIFLCYFPVFFAVSDGFYVIKPQIVSSKLSPHLFQRFSSSSIFSANLSAPPVQLIAANQPYWVTKRRHPFYDEDDDDEKEEYEIVQKAPIKFSLTNIILIFNVIAYAFTCSDSNKYFAKFAKIDYKIARGEVFRLFSAMFLHSNIPHLLSNTASLYRLGSQVFFFDCCVFLLVISSQVEDLFGAVNAAMIYFGSGFLANLGTFVFQTSPYAVGASGAISGLLGSYGYYYVHKRGEFGQHSTQGKFEDLFPLFYSSCLFGIVLQSIGETIVYNLMYSRGNVDHFAHLCGLLCKFFLSPLFITELLDLAGVGIGAVLLTLSDLRRQVNGKQPNRVHQSFSSFSSPRLSYERIKSLFQRLVGFR
jgi:membrane associated rhomboid family serine protease